MGRRRKGKCETGVRVDVISKSKRRERVGGGEERGAVLFWRRNIRTSDIRVLNVTCILCTCVIQYTSIAILIPSANAASLSFLREMTI